MKYIKKIKPFYKDKRGEMTYLLDGTIKINSVLLITSKKGSIRANHYHKKDSHSVYMLKGKMECFYRDLNKKNTVRKSIMVKAGDVVYTPPMEEHAMKFLEDSAFLALTTEKRSQKSYEKDLIRVKLI